MKIEINITEDNIAKKEAMVCRKAETINRYNPQIKCIHKEKDKYHLITDGPGLLASCSDKTLDEMYAYLTGVNAGIRLADFLREKSQKAKTKVKIIS